MSMRLAMKASLESVDMDDKAKQKALRKAKKEAKRARKAELAAAAEPAVAAALAAPAPAAAPPAAAPAAPAAPAPAPPPPAAPAPMDTSPPPEPPAAPPPAPARASDASLECKPKKRANPDDAPEPAAPPSLRARVAAHLDALLKEVNLDEMNMKSLRKRVAEDLGIDISGEDKGWFKEHVTQRVQQKHEPASDDEDPRHPVISEDMAAVVGVSRANHFRLVKLLWKYIKAHALQNPKNRNEILCDAKLEKCFKRKKVTGFGMSKLLGAHIFKDGEATRPKKAPKKKKKTRVEAPASGTDSEAEPAPKKKRKTYPKPAGSVPAYKGTPELAAFCGVETNNRFTLSKIFWAHIKANNLQSDPANKRIIVCDDKLKALFGVERFEMFAMAKHIKKHFDRGEE